MERRRFNGRERIALYILGKGHCQMCGALLTAGWHGDHVLAYSRGGITDVTNGQALCPNCDWRKGNKPFSMFHPRDWQVECERAYFEKTKTYDSFLCESTPGSGKTDAALMIAKRSLLENVIDRIVVVVPNRHLRRQWSRRASAKHNLQLDSRWNASNGRELPEYDGVVVTYHSLDTGKLIHRAICDEERTLVIFDEVHHGGENKTWGEAMRGGFELAKRKLLLSGTPFRHDDNQIPFVVYHEDNGQLKMARADYTYELERAIREKVCRYPCFPTFDGTFKWLGKRGLEETSFASDLPEDIAAERLHIALNADGGWITTVLGDANTKLDELRRTHPDAGGLIIARDMFHARALVEALKRVTGEVAELVISDEANATEAIARFIKSNQRWLVSVRMVSEGTDIPRLRVLVYASNYETELFFRQALGRILRLQGKTDYYAYVYLAKVEPLTKYAEGIMAQIQHIILPETEAPIVRGGRDLPGTPMMPLVMIKTTGEADDIITPNGAIKRHSLLAAETLKRENPHLPSSVEELAMVMDLLGVKSPVPMQESDDGPAPKNIADRREELQAEINRLANKVDYESRNIEGWIPGTTNLKWVQKTGKKTENCTIADLERKLEWVTQLLTSSQKTAQAKV